MEPGCTGHIISPNYMKRRAYDVSVYHVTTIATSFGFHFCNYHTFAFQNLSYSDLDWRFQINWVTDTKKVRSTSWPNVIARSRNSDQFNAITILYNSYQTSYCVTGDRHAKICWNFWKIYDCSYSRMRLHHEERSHAQIYTCFSPVPSSNIRLASLRSLLLCRLLTVTVGAALLMKNRYQD